MGSSHQPAAPQPRGPIGRLPPGSIVLAQAGGIVPANPNVTPWGAHEPTPIGGPGAARLQLLDVTLPVFQAQGPQVDDVVQGGISTCPAAAALVAMAHADPAAIRSLFVASSYQAGPPRVYSIRFRGSGVRAVRVTTRLYHQAGSLVYASSGNNVIWPSLLEKAYAVYRGGNSYRGLAKRQRQLGSPPDVARVMQDFVGNYLWIAHTNAQNIAQPLTGLSAAKRGDLVRALRRSTRRPTIAASLGAGVPAATNVTAEHVYAVLGYGRGRVTLRNPWNISYMPAGAQFTLSLAQFQSAFLMVLWRQ